MDDYSQFIKVYHHSPLFKEPIRLAIDKETRAEDIVIKLCQSFKIKPVARHLFNLRNHSTNNKMEWVCQFKNVMDSQVTAFDFRLRFKIPDFSKLRIIDEEAFNYYFHQVRYDVLNTKVSDISCEKQKKELLGMGVIDMYRVMLETGVPRDAVENDYKKFIPKEVYKLHLFFVKQPMLNSLKDIEKYKHKVWYVKDQYLKSFEEIAPNYLCEEYKVSMDEGGFFRAGNVHINPYDKDFPGIKFLPDGKKEIIHVCSIEELCFITVRAVKNEQSMEIARKTGIPIYFRFSTVSGMFSLLSSLDGYYRLGVKSTFSLSKDLPTPSLERLHSLKCHGPVGGEFSYRKLEKLRSNKPGCFILRESEVVYENYYLDVCTKNSSKPTTYKIEKLCNGGFSFNGGKEQYATINELLSALRAPESPVKLLECLPPSEYDVSPLLLCRSERIGFNRTDDDDDSSHPDTTVTHFIDPKELQLFSGHRKEYKGRISTVYTGLWCRKKKKKVDIAFKVFKADKHSVEEQLEMIGQWASVQSPALLRLYGITLNSPLGMVMELLPLGPLDSYLRHNHRHVKEVDLVEAANYLASALWNLEESGVVHGNIRCNKLLVASHTDSSFVVRLSDPGLPRRYTDNDAHWLAPECYEFSNSSYKTTASDIWAFGTTLWEIFSRGRHPPTLGQDTKLFYLSGKRLPQPEGCSIELYKLMYQCWTLDPQQRKKTQEAMRDINHLLYQVFNSRRHFYSTVAPTTNHNNSLSGSTEDSTVVSELTLDSETSFLEVNRDGNEWLPDPQGQTPEPSRAFSQSDLSSSTSLDVSSLQCIFELESDCKVRLMDQIGQGFYGYVYKAWMEQPHKGCEGQLVAVKRLKADSISANRQDFEREINIMKSLKHENIVEIKAVIDDPEISLVMEFIQHGSLQCYLKIYKEILFENNARLLKFALDVAKGMDYLGQKKIVHRDIAARNILVASDTHVKISDFGLAQGMGTNDYYILQTSRELPIKWYAPESLRDGKFSTRSDMWSYGVTLFEMFSLGEDPQLPSLKDSLTDQGTMLLTALEKGERLPCPASCDQTVYNELLFPCWLYDSRKRPTFKAMIQKIEKLRANYV